MMVRNSSLWIVTLLGLILWIGCGEKAIKISLKFNEGDVYKYNLTQDSVTTTEFMGKKMEMPSTTEMTITQKVEKVDQGAAEIKITYDSFDMKMNVGGKQIPSNMGEKMVGKTNRMKIRENGEIVEPQGMKAMVGFQGMSSDVNNILFNLYPRLPEKKLKVGDSWTQKQEFPQSQVNIVTEAHYTLSRKEQKNGYNCAVIDSTISMIIEGGDQAKMSINGDGKGSGTIHIAYEKGILINSEAEMDFNMSISAPLPTGQQEIPTSTHQKINLSLI
jgi:hypothetical protein